MPCDYALVRSVHQIPDCTNSSRISRVLFSFHQNEKIRFAKEFLSILIEIFSMVLNTTEFHGVQYHGKISIKSTQIIRQTLFFHFNKIKAIPWKFLTDGYNLEFDTQTFCILFIWSMICIGISVLFGRQRRHFIMV